MDLKRNLGAVVEHLKELEEKARKLQNQNFADIVRSAWASVEQLTQHPDLDAAQGQYGEQPAPTPAGDAPPFPGTNPNGAPYVTGDAQGAPKAAPPAYPPGADVVPLPPSAPPVI